MGLLIAQMQNDTFHLLDGETKIRDLERKEWSP